MKKANSIVVPSCLALIIIRLTPSTIRQRVFSLFCCSFLLIGVAEARERSTWAAYLIAQTDDSDAHPPVPTRTIIAHNVQGYSDNRCIIRRGENYAIIDTFGEVVVGYGRYILGEPFVSPHTEDFGRYGYHNGFTVAKHPRTGLYGYLDVSGDVQIPFIFKNASPVQSDGFADVQYTMPNGAVKSLYVNMAGEVYEDVGPHTHFGFREGVTSTARGFVDRQGNVIVKKDYDGATFYSEGLVAVSKRNQAGKEMWGFMDKSGGLVIPYQFPWEPGPFSEGLALIRSFVAGEYPYRYIDKQGKTVFYVKNLRNHRPEQISRIKRRRFTFNSYLHKQFEGAFVGGHSVWQKGFVYDKSGRLFHIIHGDNYGNGDNLTANATIYYVNGQYVWVDYNRSACVHSFDGKPYYKKNFRYLEEPDSVSGFCLASLESGGKVVINRNGEVVFDIRAPNDGDDRPVIEEPDPVTAPLPIRFKDGRGIIQNASAASVDEKGSQPPAGAS